MTLRASSLSMIADLYSPQRRSFAISCFTTAPTLAAILALSLGAWLVEFYGWRTTFMLVGLPALVLSLVLAFLVQEPRRGAWDAKPQLEIPVQGMLASARSLWAQPAYRTLIIASAVTTLGANAYSMWNATFLVRIHGLELRQAGMLAGLFGGGSAAIGMLFGVGLGPLSIGLLSDALTPYLGEQSLRYALLVCVLTPLIAMLLIQRVMRMAPQTESREAPAGQAQPDTP
jgi:predicted MFS family arabinose efflux permease